MTAVGPRLRLTLFARDGPIGLGVWDISTPPNSPHLVHSLATKRDFFSVQNIHFETRDQRPNGHFFETPRDRRELVKRLVRSSSPTAKCDYIWLRGAETREQQDERRVLKAPLHFKEGGGVKSRLSLSTSSSSSVEMDLGTLRRTRRTRKSLINISICSC